MFAKDLFCDHVKELRKNKKFTVEQVADGIGLSKPMVSQIENGKRLPSIPTLWKLADFYQISLDELLGREWPAQPTKP